MLLDQFCQLEMTIVQFLLTSFGLSSEIFAAMKIYIVGERKGRKECIWYVPILPTGLPTFTCWARCSSDVSHIHRWQVCWV
jgi:hypothetical protein